jgi:hypothetical protein
MQIQPIQWLGAIALLAVTFLIFTRCTRRTAKDSLRNARSRDLAVFEFRKLKGRKRATGNKMLLQEQLVKSLSHRYLGRFDAAVVHWDSEPALDVVLERKFPSRYLPDEAKSEDIFQAGLYALAIMESGFRCKNTRLAITYCLQDVAEACFHSNRVRACWECEKGRFFEASFKPEQVRRQLRRIDEIWFKGRNPRPASSPEKCIPCPHSRSGKCNYAVT